MRGRRGMDTEYWCGGQRKKTTRKTKTLVDSIKTDLGEIRWGSVDWIGLAQHRDEWSALVNATMNLRVP
jgi:hypothetical protein